MAKVVSRDAQEEVEAQDVQESGQARGLGEVQRHLGEAGQAKGPGTPTTGIVSLLLFFVGKFIKNLKFNFEIYYAAGSTTGGHCQHEEN